MYHKPCNINYVRMTYICLVKYVITVWKLIILELLPYGPENNDSKMPPGNDDVATLILAKPIILFDSEIDTLFVCIIHLSTNNTYSSTLFLLPLISFNLTADYYLIK